MFDMEIMFQILSLDTRTFFSFLDCSNGDNASNADNNKNSSDKCMCGQISVETDTGAHCVYQDQNPSDDQTHIRCKDLRTVKMKSVETGESFSFSPPSWVTKIDGRDDSNGKRPYRTRRRKNHNRKRKKDKIKVYS
jgi:hypothetical protein